MLNWADYREHVKALMAAAIAAADPGEAVRQHLALSDDRLQVGSQRIELDSTARIFIAGAGKAGVPMGRAAAEILGERLTAGVLAVPAAPNARDEPLQWIEAGHPLPDEGSLEAGRQIRSLLAETRSGDIVLALLSGGGSALMEFPREGLTLADLRSTSELLMKGGVSIEELNTVRQQLSRIKGGGVADMAHPAPVVSLIISDVVGDRPELIASGPTAKPAGTRQRALDIVRRNQFERSLPASVLAVLKADPDAEVVRGEALENVIIANNRSVAQAANRTAHEMGFKARVVSTELEGEARQAGIYAAGLAKSVLEHREPGAAPACLILGGETTVKVTGNGSGGRNQELALAAAVELDGRERWALASFDTDGIDGASPAAGAVVTGETAGAALAKGLDPRDHLARNDSHTLLSAVGADLRTGPTGTNVNDLVFVLVYPP